MRLKKIIKNETLRFASQMLPRNDKKKLGLIIFIQVSLSALDVIGVALVGILGSLTITGIQSSTSGTRINRALELMQLQGLNFQTQVAIIGLLAAFILLGRTFISILFTRRTLRFFAARSAKLSADLVRRLLTQNLLVLQQRTSQETLFAVTYGVTSLMMGILANAVTLVSDIAILVALSIALLAVDPAIAISTAAMFLSIAVIMHRLLNIRAQSLGKIDSELNIASNSKILEVLSSYRESVVHNRRGYYGKQINLLRTKLADTQAEITFMPNISKYIVETTVIFGAVLISAVQFLTQDASHAFATLAVFLAAASRLAPALLRLQQGNMYIRNNIGNAASTMSLIASLKDVNEVNGEGVEINFEYKGFSPEVMISNVSLTYPGKSNPAISSLNLTIKRGCITAFVGPSGAGKTSIIDTLLGVLIPDSGNVLISGVEPSKAISNWPGAISYVPQETFIADGTIRENIGLGYPAELVTDARVITALRMANLLNEVEALPNGFETQVGERGAQLSGGQRQRLGIARALFTNPQLLVLDEATSALDSETELRISDAILGLKGSKTVVLIAHRLSTVRNADFVHYLENGKILASGSFEEVRAKVPQFDQQAKLLGL